MKKQINIVLNGREGAGKTFFATNFVQFLKDRQISHRAIDTACGNSALKQIHPEVDIISMRNAHEIDLIFGALQYSNLIVVDCQAPFTRNFLDYFSEVRVFEVLDMVDAAMTVIVPVLQESDNAERLERIVAEFNTHCRYLIVKNQARGDDFTAFERSEVRNRVMEELGGREIVMPRLCDWLVTGLNDANFSITAAITHSAFSLIDRQRLKNWQRSFNDQLSAICDILLPTDAAKLINRKITADQTPSK